MSKIVASMFMTLDGFVVGPNEEMDWVKIDLEETGPDMGRIQSSAGAFLLGRQTYQIMAGAWPNMTEETSPGADAMNHTPKIVASSTLKQVPWGKYGNASLIQGDTLDGVRRLREKPGKDIVIFGSPRLVQSLAEAGLIDRFRIWLHPTLLGTGKPFFHGPKRVELKLVASKTYKNGVVALDYEPAASSTR